MVKIIVTNYDFKFKLKTIVDDCDFKNKFKIIITNYDFMLKKIKILVTNYSCDIKEHIKKNILTPYGYTHSWNVLAWELF